MLRNGACVSANCEGSSSVIPGLGACLSELVQVPTVSGTGSPPLPSITGLTNPTTVNIRRPLEWWQILLMALGCAFIFLMVLICWRRRARKQRAKRTAMFASAKKLDQKSNWRWRLVRFGEKLFGHNASQRPVVLPVHQTHRRQDSQDAKLQKMRETEDARHDLEMDDLLDAYNYTKAGSRSSRAPSSLPSLHGNRATKSRALHSSNRLSGHSLYSEVTGKPRQTPEPRQPIKKDLLNPRYSSASTLSSSFSIWTHERDRVPAPVPPVPQPPTEAEAYASAIRPALAASPPLNPGSYWMQPNHTGGSSRNPFRQ